VRGLDYYNGTSFEIKAATSDSLGPSQSTLLAGGRYDYLAQQFSGKEVPAIGWAAGIDRLAILMPDELISVSTTLVIGIIAMLSKDERSVNGSQVRHKCLQL
jgi:histidyl-tRNA synthetase